jgi:hypothetical protein
MSPHSYTNSARRVRSNARKIARKRFRCSASSSRVVYRGLQYSWESTVAFLDPHDIIVVNTQTGFHVFKLPLAAADDNATDNVPLAFAAHDASTRQSFCNLKSIRNGQAFVAGADSGHFKVFATEHESAWCKKQKDWTELPTTTVVQNNDYRYNKNKPFIHSLWKSHRLKRRYDYEPTYSLRHQMTMARHDSLMEISDWEQATFTSRPRCRYARWDFWDDYNSLLAAHVGLQEDYFGLRLMDERSCSRNQVVVDMEMTNEYRCMNACFLSNRTLATRCSDRSPHEDTVKIWDIRNLSRSLTSTRVAPSFPQDTVIGTSAVRTYPVDNVQERTRRLEPTVLKALPNGSIVVPERTEDSIELKVIEPLTGHAETVSIPTGESSANFLFASTNRPSNTVTMYNYIFQSLFLVDLENGVATTGHGPNRGQKRSNNGNCSGDDDGRIPIELLDQNGFDAQLTCLTVDATGTKVAGMSTEGDLFLIGQTARM